MDKARKAELKRQHKERERREARERLGLTQSQLQDLLDYLEEGFRLGLECDHSPARARQWIRAEGLGEKTVLEAIGTFAVFCDCEINNNLAFYDFGWTQDEGA